MNKNEPMGDIIISIRFIAFSLLVLAGIYPILVTLYANIFFKGKANGSLVINQNKNVDSSLISEDYTNLDLFQSRPSATNYQTMPSGASNLSRTSEDLKLLVIERKNKLRERGIDTNMCPELLYASASGLDPHITTLCALEQAQTLSIKHKIEKDILINLIHKNTESSILGMMGRERVNVVNLNIELRNLLNVR